MGAELCTVNCFDLWMTLPYTSIAETTKKLLVPAVQFRTECWRWFDANFVLINYVERY